MGASADRRLVAGRYVLGGPLGRGGMGTVWRAEDALLGRPVAVKEVELPSGAGAAPGALRERALREARAAPRDGNRHDPDLAATLGNGGDWSAQLNPGQRLAGTLVYDIPEAAVPARVELHDAALSGGASVALD